MTKGLNVTYVVLVGLTLCLMTTAQATAQTAVPSAAPNCAIAPGGPSTMVCTAELDGNGKQQLIVGSFGGASGYVIIINSNGTIRKKICWRINVGFDCPTIDPP